MPNIDVPTKDNTSTKTTTTSYKFLGYFSADGVKIYDENGKATGNWTLTETTLTAHWQETTTDGGTEDEENNDTEDTDDVNDTEEETDNTEDDTTVEENGEIKNVKLSVLRPTVGTVINETEDIYLSTNITSPSYTVESTELTTSSKAWSPKSTNASTIKLASAAEEDNTVEIKEKTDYYAFITLKAANGTYFDENTTVTLTADNVKLLSTEKLTEPSDKITFSIRFRGLSSEVMYRLYNPNSGEHFYTADAAEQAYLVTVGWNYEGTAWTAITEGTAVYRLYNKNSGEHHYTQNETERDMLKKLGWKYESIAWYTNDVECNEVVYRLYNPNTTAETEAGAHHYTMDEAEKDYLVSIGWAYEGISWNGL